MTYQEKVDFLRMYNDNSVRIYGLSQEAERWRQIATSIGASSDGLPHRTPAGGRIENAAAHAADIVREIELDIETARAEREQVKDIISTASRRQRNLLELHYINGVSPFNIANQYGKSEKWIRQMLKDAVNNLNF